MSPSHRPANSEGVMLAVSHFQQLVSSCFSFLFLCNRKRLTEMYYLDQELIYYAKPHIDPSWKCWLVWRRRKRWRSRSRRKGGRGKRGWGMNMRESYWDFYSVYSSAHITKPELHCCAIEKIRWVIGYLMPEHCNHINTAWTTHPRAPLVTSP